MWGWILILVAVCFGCSSPRDSLAKLETSGSYSIGSKAFPAIVGNQTFHLDLSSDPVLRYKLVSPSNSEGHIVVSSDFPSALRREYTVDPGSTSLSLKEFAGRVAEISFSAQNSPPPYWVNPRIEERASNRTVNHKELQRLRERHKGDNVLVVVFDAAVASHMSCYGYPRKTTPTVDGLAREGVLFENAIAQAPFTSASTATLLTGFHPLVHRVGIDLDRLDGSYRTLPEFFLMMGYDTALFTGNPNASPILGFGQGFQKSWRHESETPSMAGDLATQAISWLKQEREKPFFAYLHFREPHVPYSPPRPFVNLFSNDSSWLFPYSVMSKRLKNSINWYDGNLAYVDSELQKLLQVLNKRTIIVILADHGEAFYEHGVRGHNRHVYDEFIRIPFILRFPDEPGLQGLRRKDPVGTMDLFATFCDLFGFRGRFASGNGASLLPLLSRSTPFEDRRMISRSRGPSNVYSVRSVEFKLISYMKESVPDEFYRLSNDRYEQRNVIRDYPVLSRYYKLELQKYIDRWRKEGELMPGPKKPQQALDEETREQLRALGYVDN